MSAHSVRCRRYAPRAGLWLSVSLALVPALAGAADSTARVEPVAQAAPAQVDPAAQAAPAVQTAPPAYAEPGELGESAARTGPAARVEPAAQARPVLHAHSAPSLAAQPPIGRIFFSPAERRSRRSGGLDAPAAPAAALPDSRPAADERTVINGALSLGTEGRAVWINGAAIDNSSGNKRAWTDGHGHVWLNEGAQGVRLMRPGQSIDRQGAIEDLLPAGSVTRH